jgi:hypothetical protein
MKNARVANAGNLPRRSFLPAGHLPYLPADKKFNLPNLPCNSEKWFSFQMKNILIE